MSFRRCFPLCEQDDEISSRQKQSGDRFAAMQATVSRAVFVGINIIGDCAARRALSPIVLHCSFINGVKVEAAIGSVSTCGCCV